MRVVFKQNSIVASDADDDGRIPSPLPYLRKVSCNNDYGNYHRAVFKNIWKCCSSVTRDLHLRPEQVLRSRTWP